MARNKSVDKINVVWEYCPTPDAEARLEAAFDLLFSKSFAKTQGETQNLTESEDSSIMPHDDGL